MQGSQVLELTNLCLFPNIMFGKECVLQNPYYCTLEGEDNKFYFGNKLQYVKLNDKLFILILIQVHNHQVFNSCARISQTFD